MKKQFKGFSKIFSFTFEQHVRNKGYKNTTIVIALLCLILPALIMTWAEKIGGSEPSAQDRTEISSEAAENAENYFADIESVKRVIAVDLSEDKKLDISMIAAAAKEMTGADIAVTDMGGDLETARRAAEGSDDALIMVTEQEGDLYNTSIVLPDGSGISFEAAESFQAVFDQYTEMLKAREQPAETEGEDVNGIKSVVTMIVSFINIMFLYFFVLFYGQGVSGSIVMEKSSKLVESLLISVKPVAMIFGKLLAITAAGVLQFLLWLLSAVLSFTAGSIIVKSMNPDTDMLVIRLFENIDTMLDGMLSPLNCIIAVLMVISGLLLYCSLAAIGGALASKTEDLSSTNIMFTLILVASFFGVLAGGGMEAGGEINPVLDWIPFTSVMITPGRALLGTLPLWKTAACFAVTLAVTLLAVFGAGKIYKSMILYKGNVPKVKDIINMLKRA